MISNPCLRTFSAAFWCVQAWLLEKLAAWADDPCLAAAQMAQRPSAKRPCKDALLEAKRSHQRRRIELLKEQLLGKEAEVQRLARKLEDTEPAAVIEEEAGQIFTALRTATRLQRAELALRWFEAGITWRARWGGDDKGPQPTLRSLSVSGRRSYRRRCRDVHVEKEGGSLGPLCSLRWRNCTSNPAEFSGAFRSLCTTFSGHPSKPTLPPSPRSRRRPRLSR